MLQKLSEKVAHCHRCAREAKEKAERATDRAVQRDYFNLERRWLMLAESYTLTERISIFHGDMKQRIAIFTPPTPPHPVLPRVMCPSCGRRMRLTQIEPTWDSGHAERTSFECVCGHTLAETADQPDAD